MNIFKNRNIVFELSRKQVKTQYRDSTFGFIWTVLNPLLNMLVMWVVFQSVLGIKDPYYPIYLLTGNILFAAVRASTTQALESMVVNRDLLLRTKLDLEVFPMSNVLTSIINFGFSLIALIPFMIWLSISRGVNLFSYQLPFMILMIPALLLFEYGLGLILSVCFVFFRDLKHLYGVFLTLWQYLTPIFYVVDFDNVGFAGKLIKLNPMFHFVNYFRDSVYRGASGIPMNILDPEAAIAAGTFTPQAFIPKWDTLGYIYAFAVGALLIGLLLFKLLKRKIITRI